MIKISQQYIHRFKRWPHLYVYPITKGIYLAFDDKTLEYLGIEMFYLPRNNNYQTQADDLLNNLLSNGLLESF